MSFIFDPFSTIPKAMGRGEGGQRCIAIHFKLRQVMGVWRWDNIPNIMVHKDLKEFLAETDYPCVFWNCIIYDARSLDTIANANCRKTVCYVFLFQFLIIGWVSIW
jgi:hypothetical protein